MHIQTFGLYNISVIISSVLRGPDSKEAVHPEDNLRGGVRAGTPQGRLLPRLVRLLPEAAEDPASAPLTALRTRAL